jgi:hypothetical protein
MGDPDLVAFRDAKKVPGGFGQSDLVEAQHGFTVDLKKSRLDLALAIGHENLRARSKSLGPADVTVGTHDYDRLMLAMQPETAYTVPWLIGTSSVICRRHRSKIWF